MNYELAKQLRDAGFPNSNEWIECDTLQGKTYRDVDGYGVPTLEELIEALPEEYCELRRFKKNQWVAACGWHETYENAAGETAIEAVAKLWLALQTKSL